MKDNEFIVVCPCCETKLWIDKETGGILKHVQPDKDKKSFDGLVAKYKEQKAGIDKAFSQAFDDEKKRKKLIQKKFKRAMENIDELENSDGS